MEKPVQDFLVLTPSPVKLQLLVAGSLAFVLIGVLVMSDAGVARWLVIGFFGMCAAVGLVSLMPGASSLVLRPSEFEVTSLFRSWRVSWSDVAGFGTIRVGGRTLVAWNLTDGASKAKPSWMKASLFGADGALPDSYGLSPQKLVELLTAWRDGQRRKP